MKVSDRDMAAVLAVLTGDVDGFEGLQEESGSTNGEGFAALMAMAFIGAVRDRFSSGWSLADIIRFVGQVRVRNENYDVRPTVAEEMLVAALRNTPLPGWIDEFAKGYAQVAVLAELVGDLDEEQLGVFLAKARVQAEQWLTEGPGSGVERPVGSDAGASVGQQVAALRALLTKNFEEHTRLISQLDDDGMHDYMALVSAAFFEAVDRRFGNADLPAAVIEFVGNARSRNAKAAETIDPAVTQRVILKALGHGSISDLPGREIRRVQNLMLALLVDDERLDAVGIEALLAAARKLAQP